MICIDVMIYLGCFFLFSLFISEISLSFLVNRIKGCCILYKGGVSFVGSDFWILVLVVVELRREKIKYVFI